MTRSRLALALVCLLSPVLLGGRSGVSDAVLEGIRPEAIRAHMTFLADDLLEGRGSGTRGYELAARYVAAQFEALGLEPGGEDGTYFQSVPFRGSRVVEEASSFTLIDPDGREEPFPYGERHYIWPDLAHESNEIEAPLVFVGYGIHAPEAGYDDFAGVDVKGKILVRLRTSPPVFDADERAYYAASRNRNLAAVERGAVGVLTIQLPEDAAKRPWEQRVLDARTTDLGWVGRDGGIHGAYPEFRVYAAMSAEGAERILAGAPHDPETIFAAMRKGEPLSFDLPGRVRASNRYTHTDLASPNVVGILPGDDPALAGEYVLFSSHLDHLGMGEEVDGDAIFNGAYDNASGIAMMIETARAMTQARRGPRRSVLFLAVTGEERGLLGSEYYAEYPTVPMADVVANINVDMLLLLSPLEEMIAFGIEHSTLEEPVRIAARELGVRIVPDPTPEEVYFVRSDQYSFVRKGVPAIFLDAGHNEGGEVPEGSVDWKTWTDTIYHSRKDDMNQYFDWEAAVTFTRANVLIGLQVANDPRRPRWNDGDFFGERFGRGSEP